MAKDFLKALSENIDPHKLLLGIDPDSGEWLTYSGDAPLITVAPTRTGKTQSQVLPNLLSWPAESSAIVLDVKDELHHTTAGYRGKNGSAIRKFDIFRDGGAHFNPFDFISDDSARLWDDAAYFADLMIVAPPGLKDPFWTDYSRIILQAILGYMVLADEPRNMRFILATLSDKQKLKECVQELQQCGIDAARITGNFIAQAIEAESGASKGSLMLHSVVQQAFTYLNRLYAPTITKSISSTDWKPQELRQRGTTVYITLPAGSVKQYLPLLRLVLGVHVRELLKTKPKKNDRPVLMLLDEFPQLGEMNAIEQALELGGYDLKIWMFCQSIDQLTTQYGKHTRITSQCAVHSYMNPSGQEGDNLAQIISAAFGFKKSRRDN